MNHICGDCIYWKPWIDDDMGEDAGGVCTFQLTLPHAWRYTPREVVSVDRNEQSNCLTFESKSIKE